MLMRSMYPFVRKKKPIIYLEGQGEGKDGGKENKTSHVVCGGHRRTCTNQFSLPRIWVLLGLTASAFINWAIRLALQCVLGIPMSAVSALPQSLLELQIVGPTFELLNYKHCSKFWESVFSKSFNWFWWHAQFENNGLNAILICSPVMKGSFYYFQLSKNINSFIVIQWNSDIMIFTLDCSSESTDNF